MSHRFVNQLGDQETVDDIFVAANKQLRPNRNGNLYLQVDLSDRSGSIAARMWNASDEVYRSFENGDYVRVEGSTQVYQGAIQMIARSIERARGGDVNEGDFQTLTAADTDRLTVRLGELLRGMNDPHLCNLAECFLVDEDFMQRFTRAPAGIKHHHAYVGGLLEHVVNLMEVVTLVAGRYPEIDRDLLLMGAFLHDVGKIRELSYDRGFAYTDEGQLIGHVVIAVGMLEAKADETAKLSGEPIPEETLLRLKHMIVSHHGQYDFGSPKLPMTLEAVALTQLDNLDAKVRGFHQQMLDDANSESHWTFFNHALGRKLFKGAGPQRNLPDVDGDE